MRRASLLIISFFCLGLLQSQTRTTDSLRRLVHTAPAGEPRLKAILALCEEQASLERDTLDHYAFIARGLALHTHDERLKSLAELAVATDYYRFGWRDSAYPVIRAALRYNTASNTATRDLYFRFMRLLALCYTGAHRYADALNTLYTTFTEAQRYGDNLVLAKTAQFTGNVETMRGKPNEGLKWCYQALSYCKNDPAYEDVQANIYSTMGAAYGALGRRDSASYFNLRAIGQFRQQQNLFNLAISLQRQADIYIAEKNIPAAAAILDSLKATNTRTHEDGAYLRDNLSFINFYILSGQYAKAIAMCNEHLVDGSQYDAPVANGSNHTNSTANLRIPYYEVLARCYKEKGDNALYAATLEKLLRARDSFYTSNSAEALAEVQTKFEVQKKEATIAQQKLDLVTKNYQLYGSLMLAGLGVIIAWLLFVLFRRRQRQQLTQLQEEEKRLAEAAVTSAEESERRRIAANLHDSLGAYAASISASVTNLKDHYSPQLLQNIDENAQNMVKQLGDTIWVLNKTAVSLTAIGDRFKRYLQDILKNYPAITASFSEDMATDPELPSAQALHLFRMMQECTNNACRHSDCTDILIRLHAADGAWQVSIADNGRGFDTDRAHAGNGLGNLRGRAAQCGWQLAWAPAEGGGTIVTISNMKA